MRLHMSLLHIRDHQSNGARLDLLVQATYKISNLQNHDQTTQAENSI
jgi:hypothetical protein